MHERESARALLKVKNHFWKQFSHKMLYNYYSKFFWEPFGQNWKKFFFLNGSPIVFPKMDLTDVGGNFHIWALKLLRTVYITTLKNLRGAYSFVCTITLLYPQASYICYTRPPSPWSHTTSAKNGWTEVTGSQISGLDWCGLVELGKRWYTIKTLGFIWYFYLLC